MILDSEYVRICDLFEDAVKRASQLSSLAAVVQDAITSPDSSPKALHNTAWLLSELLQEHCGMLTELQDAHRKDHLTRHGK